MEFYEFSNPIADNFVIDVDQGVIGGKANKVIQQGEHDARYLQVELVQNGVPVDLTNCDVYFLTRSTKSNTKPTMTLCEIFDTERGNVKVQVKNYMTNKDGVIECEFVRIGHDKTILPFKKFNLTVDGSIYTDDAIESSEPLHALVDALATVREVEQLLGSEFMDLEAKYAGELSKTNAQLSQKIGVNDVNVLNINVFDEETRRAILENNEMNINYILGESSVELRHMMKNLPPSFLEGVSVEHNILDSSRFTKGGLNGDGSLNVYNGSHCSDFEFIQPNTKYYRKNTTRVVLGFYDINKNFITRPTIDLGVTHFITPTDAYYLRYTDVDEFIFNEVISLFPVENYVDYTPQPVYKFDNSIYKYLVKKDDLDETFKVDNELLSDDFKIDRKLLTESFLYHTGFLDQNTDLDTITSDGCYIVKRTSINKPDELIYEDGFMQVETYDNRWTIQRIYSWQKINHLMYFRLIDKTAPQNSTDWMTIDFTNMESRIANLEKINNSNVSKFKNKKILTMGDSITQGVGASDESTKGYPYLLQQKSGAKVTNRGVSGARWQNQNNSYDSFSIVNLSKEIDYTQYDYVTIFAGTNDFGGHGNLGEVSDELETTMCGAINLTIRNILQSNPEIKIALITPMWRQRFSAGDNLDSDTNTIKGKYLREFSEAIIECAKKNHIPVLNLYDTCIVNKYNYETYFADGLHPNDYGYEYLADRIFAFLESVF